MNSLSAGEMTVVIIWLCFDISLACTTTLAVKMEFLKTLDIF